MPMRTNSQLSFKIVILGVIIAALLYVFHPGVGQFNLLINGQPVADPLFRLAALPALLVVMVLVAGLGLLALFGVSMMLFFAALAFALGGILLIAPYFWPVLLVLCLVIAIMASGGKSESQ